AAKITGGLARAIGNETRNESEENSQTRRVARETNVAAPKSNESDNRNQRSGCEINRALPPRPARAPAGRILTAVLELHAKQNAEPGKVEMRNHRPAFQKKLFAIFDQHLM